MEKLFEDIKNAISVSVSNIDAENSVRQLIKDYNANNDPQIPFKPLWEIIKEQIGFGLEMKREIDALKEEVSDLEEVNEGLTGKAAGNEEEIQTLKYTTSRLEEENDTLSDEIKDLKEFINNKGVAA